MLFSSVQFLFFFLPLTLALYYVLPKKCRNLVLAAVSLLFFLWSALRYAAMLVLFAAFNWCAGLLLQRYRSVKPLLGFTVGVDLALLLYFKYAGFFAQSINSVLSTQLPIVQLALPLGISFYVFVAVGYCIDVALGRIEAEKNPVRFFVFLAFFGHGPSGPIVQYTHQQPMLAVDAPARKVDVARFCFGIKRFSYGLAKKALIADQLGYTYARITSVSAEKIPGFILLVGYAMYLMQLYFDFSGYSDMAVGLGEMLGLRMPENFKYPYQSATVGEFWRRWHITLSDWFQTYVYFPLGGSRCSMAKTCRNLLIVFALTGLWHGAAWNYVVFGLYHGVLLCIERLFLRRWLQTKPKFIGHCYTMLAVYFGFIMFGAPGFEQGIAAIRGILTMQPGAAGMTMAAFMSLKQWLIFAVACVLCGPLQAIFPKMKACMTEQAPPKAAEMLLILVLLFLGIASVSAGNYQAFIYFQF